MYDGAQYCWISHVALMFIWPWYELDQLPLRFLLLSTMVVFLQLPGVWPPMLEAEGTADSRFFPQLLAPLVR